MNPQPHNATVDDGVIRIILRHRRLLVLALVLAVLGGIAAGFRVERSPLRLESRSIPYGFATVQLLVDGRSSVVGNARRDLTPIGERAEVFASLFTSDDIRESVARSLSIRSSAIILTTIQDSLTVGDNTDAQQELAAAVSRMTRYKVAFKAERRGPQGSVALPLITVTGEAPSRVEAEKLVLAATNAAMNRVSSRAPEASERRQIVPLRVSRIGPVRGVTVQPGGSKMVAIGYGAAVLGLLLALIVAWDRLVLTRAPGPRGSAPADAPVQDGDDRHSDGSAQSSPAS